MFRDHYRYISRYFTHPQEAFFNILYWKKAKISFIPFVFVLGAPRSGTTLMHSILLNHPLIHGFAAETSILSPKSIFDYSRFSDLVSEEVWKESLQRSRDIVTLFEHVHVRAFPQGVGPGNRFVEKTPQHVKRLSFILRHFPEAIIVHMIRDGRDAFCSGRAAANIPQASSVAAYSRYWEACIESRLREHSDRIVDVRYEDFASNPHDELSRVMDIIGVDANVSQLLAASRNGDARASTREFSRLSQTISASSVGRWRGELSDAEVAEFESYAAKGLAAFGYERAF